MADYRLKTRVRVSTTLNTELYKRFQTLSQETLIPISKLLDKAMDHLLNEYETPNTDEKDK